jgi:type VI secretion system protein ImpA
MATPAGRGWLDLQRYAVTACDRLGQPYALPGAAIRASLRTYLKDVPQLLNAHLMDDTPTANSETADWIAREIEIDAATSGEDGSPGGQPGADRTYQVALEAARGGDSSRALSMITAALASERSERGRFVRRTQLAHILVESGQHAIALPLLEDLLKLIDDHRLELWEAGEFVSQPLFLMHRVLTKTGDAQGRIPALYLRICKIDPLKAIECAR